MTTVWDNFDADPTGLLTTVRVGGEELKHNWYWVKKGDDVFGIALSLPNEFKANWVSDFVKKTKLNVTTENGANGFFACALVDDSDLAPVYERLSNDLIESCEFATDISKVFAIFGNRISSWIKLFTGGKKLLTDEKIIGLLSELVFLDEYWMRYVSGNYINGWGGPKRAAQDFSNAERLVAVEVKGKAKSKSLVKINSKEQLDFKGMQYLCVFDGFYDENGGERSNLNSLAKEIRKKLDESNVNLFDDLLLKAGYVFDPFYDTKTFVLSEPSFYLIDDSFPRLTANSLPIGIEQVRYEIDVSKIAEHQAPLEQVVKELSGE